MLASAGWVGSSVHPSLRNTFGESGRGDERLQHVIEIFIQPKVKQRDIDPEKELANYKYSKLYAGNGLAFHSELGVAAKRSEVLRYADTTTNSTTPSSKWNILRKPASAKVASVKGDATPLDDLRDTLAQLHCEYKRVHERTVTSCTSGKGGPMTFRRPKQLEPIEHH